MFGKSLLHHRTVPAPRRRQLPGVVLSPPRIFITGASSGIGEHLAIRYAREGAVVGLAARRMDLLVQVAGRCRQAGGTGIPVPLDVTDDQACAGALQTFAREQGGIDILIANAGVSGGDQLWSGNPVPVNNLLTTNVLGVTNVVYPVIPIMEAQGGGRVVIVSSVAGYRGLPLRTGYSVSKAALRLLADGWRPVLARKNIGMTTIHPGFIRTPLTAGRTTFMPFLMDAETAAEKIRTAITRGRKNYIFPWQWRLLLPLIRSLPESLVARSMGV